MKVTGIIMKINFIKFITRFCRKSGDSRGFTLIETMTTCVILALISAIMVTGTQIGLKVLSNSAGESEGKVLCSTISSMIKDELRYAGSFTVDSDGNLVSYFSQNFGSSEDSEESDIAIDGDGHVTVVGEQLRSKWSYVSGLKADNVIVVYKNGIFGVTVTVEDGSGKVVAKQKFDVKPVNNISPTLERK